MSSELEESLRNDSVRSCLDQKPFLPNAELKRLVTRRNVAKIVPIDDGFGLDENLRVLATLIFRGKLNNAVLEALVRTGLKDNCLPVTYHHHRPQPPTLTTITKTRLMLSPPLSGNACSDFSEDQWRFLAPTLGGAHHMKLDENCVLPVIELARETWGGAFGVVSKVKIHHSHLSLPDAPAPTHENNPNLALKYLRSDNDKEFDRERDALERIQRLHNPHLISFLGSFEKGTGHFYFLFPWAAGGHLGKVWEDQQRARQPRSPEMMRWVLRQLKGLANAVDTLHNYGRARTQGLDPGDAQPDSNLRHGDLRPENILLFLDRTTNDPFGTLRITDAGLARFHAKITSDRTRGTTTTSGSIQYAPPESRHEGEKRSRSYDIWSLGCIFLEFAIWILGGHVEVKAFWEERSKTHWRSELHHEFPPFYSIASSKGDVETYSPNLAVTRRMKAIKKDVRVCRAVNPTFLYELVGLIENGMLKIEEKERFTAGRLVHELESMITSARLDSYFWADGTDTDFRLLADTPLPVEIRKKRRGLRDLVLDKISRKR